MIRVVFFCFCLTVSSSLKTLHQLISCNQPDLDNCTIGNCSEPLVVKRTLAPTGPEWGPEWMGVVEDRGQFKPVLNVSWEIQATASINALQGSQIFIQDEKTNETICLKYVYKLPKPLNRNYERWTFTLDGLVVQPEHTYFVTIHNIPQPNSEEYRIMKEVVVPDYPPRTMMVKFVGGGVIGATCLVYFLLRTCTSINPTSQAPASTPQFADNNNDTPQCTQGEPRRRLLIIYSLDHPLYKNIVLKLCGFLRAKCGTEVILDMLDSTRLGMIGGLQWLEWHKRQIEKSSDKILILCSRGVQAKWNAMCTGKRIQLKEDVLSTVGDMLVPALCLMVPEFVKSTTFEKYIVAYFDGVSSEDDVPSPFHITRLSGGTTVSATMIAAHGVGIPVFVTGGIGGVHRDGENSLDISADLTELGRTPIAVVSAGVKSILDIGRTLEYLETQGVCVATYGSSNKFPAFFSPQSGFNSPHHVCNPWEAAELIASTLSLGLQSGILFAVPIPAEHAAAGQEIEDAIQVAVKEISGKRITGRDVTPYILQKVNKLTKGKSLRANIALIHNNAKVGSQIACALSKSQNDKLKSATKQKENLAKKNDIVVIGGINVDFIAKGKTDTLLFGQTNPGSVCQSFGGVGRNIADSLSRLGHNPLFISATGTDTHSEAVFNHCKHMNTSGVVKLHDKSTATYCAVITASGELSLGLGDMDIHQQITEQYVAQFENTLASSTLVCLDGNLPVTTINYVCSLAKKHSMNVWYEPTDSDKASKPFLSEAWKSLSYTSPNLSELCTMNKTLGLEVPQALPESLDEVLELAMTLSRPLLEHLHCLIVTLGPYGVLVCGESKDDSIYLQPRKFKIKRQLGALYYPALNMTDKEIVNVSGAGDSLAGAMIAGMLQGRDVDRCVRMGLLAAQLSPRPIWSESLEVESKLNTDRLHHSPVAP
uniref:SEFIR domain-containing protein n=1 Tax=Knipowitschia caucasica TaxID=637954 RepID=A0AAV2L1W4_KNICA